MAHDRGLPFNTAKLTKEYSAFKASPSNETAIKLLHRVASYLGDTEEFNKVDDLMAVAAWLGRKA